MSSSVENKVVSMKFDNSSFESKAQSTLSVLQKLKDSLNFKGASRSLGELDSAGKKFDLSSIGQGVDAIQSKFSALSVMGIAALASLGAKAMQVGTSMVKSMVFDKPLAGLREYETQLNAVQTILNNTEWQGTNIKQVNSALDELNSYADETIYNFTEMARNVGMFTAAGVKLETSVASIKGIANLAALSGSNSQQAATAMYQLSQAISSGTVRLMDWNSVVNAGMGGRAFQRTLIETAKTHGINVDAMIKKEGSFRETLQKGWLSSKIMTQALSTLTGDLSKKQLIAMGYSKKIAADLYKQGQNAKNAATMMKTMTQVVDTLNESIGSGWAQTFRTIFGDYKQAAKLFTEIGDALTGLTDKQSSARNKMLKDWAKLGGRTAVIDGLRNVLQSVWRVMEQVGQAWRDVFPATTGKQLADISKAFLNWTKTFKMSSTQLATVRSVATTFFGVLKAGVSVLHYFADGIMIGFNIISRLLGVLWNITAPIRNFVGGLLGGVSASQDLGSFVSDLIERLIDLRTKALQPVYEWLDRLSQSTEGWKDIGKGVDEAKNRVVNFAGALEWLNSAWTSVKNFAGQAWSKIKEIASAIGNFIVDLATGVPGAFARLGNAIRAFGASFAGFFTSIGDAWKANLDSGVITQLLAILQSGILLGFFLKFQKFMAGSKGIKATFIEVLENLGGAIEQLTGTLKTMQSDIKANIILKIALAVTALAGAMWILSKINPEQLMTASIGLAVAMGILLGAVAIMSKISKSGGILQMPVISAALLILAGALLLLSIAVQRFSTMSWDELARGLVGTAGGMIILATAAKLMSKSSGDLIRVGVAMILISAALLVLYEAVSKFGTMDMGVLLQGGIAVVVLMAALQMFTARDPKSMLASAVAIMAIATSINMLVGAVFLLGSMNFGTLIQGGIAVVALMGSMALAAKLAQGSMGGAAAMVAMALAINMLLIPIAVLGNMDLGTLAQGLIVIAVALGILVGATRLMQTAVAGAGAMIAVALALGILAGVIYFVGSMDLATIATGLGVLVVALLAFGGIAALLAPIAPAMYAMAGAVAVLGVGVALIGGGLIAFAVGLTMLGPAAAIGAGGLKLLAEACASIAPQAAAIFGVGIAFGVLGAAVLVLGAGVVVLAAGLVLLGAGLTLLAASGPAGAAALMAVVEQIKPLIWDVITIGAIGAAFAVLGAGLVLAGAGALAFAIGGGAMMVIMGALMFILPGVAPQFEALVTSSQKLKDCVAPLQDAGAAMLKFGANTKEISTASSVAAAAVQTFVASFKSLGDAAKTAGTDISSLPKQVSAAAKGVSSSYKTMQTSVTGSTKNIDSSLKSLTKSVSTTSSDIPKSTTKIIDAFTKFGTQAVAKVNSAGNSIRSSLSSLSASVGSSAYSVGSAIIDGMVRGMANSGRVAAAARSVALAALNAAKAALDSHSPSREFEKLGKFANQGFAKGLRGNSDQVKKAFNDMRDMIKSSLAQAKNDIKTAQDKLSRLNKIKKKDKDDYKAIRVAKKELALAQKLKKNTTAAYKTLTKNLDDERDALVRKAKALDKVNAKLETAQKNLEDAIKVRDDARASYRDQYSQFADIESDTKLEDFITTTQAQIAATKKFREDLAALRSQGLSDKMYKELLEKGVDAQAFVDQIKDAGWGGITNLNELGKQLDTEADTLAKAASTTLYQAGVDAARGIRDGLAKEAGAIEKQMATIAKKMVKAIKKELGIKSPSRVLSKEVGQNSAKGIAKGLDKGSSEVIKKAENVAKSVTSAVESNLSLDKLGNLGGFHEVPVIKPVLDLTDVRRGVDELDAMMNRADVIGGSSYKNAAAMSRAERAQGEIVDDATPSENNITFNQYNNSPKALSTGEIYRQTRNQVSRAKGKVNA